MKGRGVLEDLGIDERIILKHVLKKSYRISWWTGTNFGFLCTRHWNFGFRTTRKLFDQLRNCQLFKSDRLMEVVSYSGWYSDMVFCRPNVTCRNWIWYYT